VSRKKDGHFCEFVNGLPFAGELTVTYLENNHVPSLKLNCLSWGNRAILAKAFQASQNVKATHWQHYKTTSETLKNMLPLFKKICTQVLINLLSHTSTSKRWFPSFILSV
jgi:hypothetical protein